MSESERQGSRVTKQGVGRGRVGEKRKINELRTHEKLGQNKSLNGSKMVLIFSWWRRLSAKPNHPPSPHPSIAALRVRSTSLAHCLPLVVAAGAAAPLLVVKICCAPAFPAWNFKAIISVAFAAFFLCVCVCLCLFLCPSRCHSTPLFTLLLPPLSLAPFYFA